MAARSELLVGLTNFVVLEAHHIVLTSRSLMLKGLKLGSTFSLSLLLIRKVF